MAGFLSLVRRLYLSVYNWTIFAGWVQVLYLVLKTLKESGHEHVYNAAEKPLLFAQTAAFLEILHSLVGLVRSPVSATLPQISSRLFLLWGILWSFPETQTHILVTSLLLSWSITEIVRYAFFGLKETLGFAPSWLLWLRYSSFLVLYVTGISSEVGLIYIALPFIKFGLVEKERAASSFTKIAFCITLAVITIASEKYCVRMPNKWNFSFDYFYAAIVVLGIYVPGSPHMYTYMLAQRKKALSKSKRE